MYSTTAQPGMPLNNQLSHPGYVQSTQNMPRKQFMQNRRRTLQTVDELSSYPPLSSDWDSSSPSGTNSGSLDSRTSHGNSDSSDRKRRDRPRTIGYGQDLRPQPSIVITDADPLPIQRSVTAPVEYHQGPRKYSNTPGANRQNLSTQSSPQKAQANEVRPDSFQRKQSGNGHPSTSSNAASRTKQNVSNGRQHGRPSNSMAHPSHQVQGSTNAKQHEHKTGRSHHRQRLSTGSSSVLPSMSPLPTTKPSAAQIRGYGNQQQLLQNSRSMNRLSGPGQLEKRASHSQMDQHLENAAMDARLLKRASMSRNMQSNPHVDPISRPRSTQYGGLPVNPQSMSQNTQMPPLFRNPPQRSFTSPPPQNQYASPMPPSRTAGHGRSSRSSLPNQHSNVRSSSAHSAVTAGTATSAGTNHSNKSRRSSGSRTSRHQQGVTREHLEALAALTGSPQPSSDPVTPESLAFQKKLDGRAKRASGTSDQLSRTSQGHTNRTSRAGSRVSAHSYGTNGARPKEDGTTPESIRLLREREKLLRWKAEREKKEFERREREKIKERVRRANELEMEKSKELEEKQKKEKQKKRGCFGIFGL